jgi:3-oxoacyl-[acyl-carrier-protein] synthase II
MSEPRVLVTGLGVVSSIGFGWRRFWEALLAGRSGIGRMRYIDVSASPTPFGGEIHDFEPRAFMPTRVARRLGRAARFALAATEMALEDAGLGRARLAGRRVGVCLGTTMADVQGLEATNETWVRRGVLRVRPSVARTYPSCVMAASVASCLDLDGPNLVIPTACAAGNYAIAYAADLIRLGKADVMIAGGADPLSKIAFTGFSRIFAIAPERCQPFDRNRQGILLGEGAAVMVLEPAGAAAARGRDAYAAVLGSGLSCDAQHMAIPDVGGVTRVMRSALAAAGVTPGDVDYVCAHGTGTPANDRTEAAAIRAVFGERAPTVPVSSIKSMLGHTMGGASALEAVACALAVHQDRIPPTMNFETPDPECPLDCVPNASRRQRVRIALNNAFAFGGNNACLVLGKAA